EGALAVAGRKRPRDVRRRQTGIFDVGDFRRGHEIDRRPAQIGDIGTPAAVGKTRSVQAVATIALARRKNLEDRAHRPEALIHLRGKRAVSLGRLLRQIKRNRVQLAQGNAIASAAPQASKTIDPGKSEIRDWQSLVGDGSVGRLILTIADVNKAFEKSGNAGATAHPEEGDADDTFIDLYVADVAVPTIGRSLLGDDGYNRLAGRLKPGQQALIVAGSGRYSFKGAAYVRGGIFDRIELIQDTNSIRFRDRDHTRLGNLAAEGAPDFPEIALFVVPPEFALDPTEPWMLQLLVQRVVATREKAWLTFNLGYTLPDAYMKRERAPPVKQQTTSSPAASPAAPASAKRDGAAYFAAEDEPLWMKIWRGDVVKIGTTIVALGALTLIFFFQN